MNIIPFEDKTPTIGEGCFVAPGSTVIGDVVLGARTSVWFGTVIRGDVFHIRIGARTNIQDNSVIHVTSGTHATIVGNDVTVGHRAILHGCTVEDGALIGMGSIVMDRAVIGAGALVAAGAIVTEGTVIPPGMLAVGAPARPKRALTDEEKQFLGYSAEHYAQLAEKFINQLKPSG